MKKIVLPLLAAPDKSALFDAIVGSSRDAIITITDSGIIQNWSPAAAELFGYPHKEMSGKNISLVIPPGYMNEHAAMMQITATTHSKKEFTSVRQRKDGKRFNVSITVSCVEEVKGRIFLLIIRDISGHQAVTDDAVVTATHLQAIFENAEEGFVLIDRDCIIKVFNSNARESIVLSYNHQDLKAGHSIFDYIEEKRKPFFKEMTEAVLAGKSLRYDRSYKRQDGQTAWYNFSLNPVREGDIITGICITGNDITKRKIAEQVAEQNEMRFRGMVENSGDAVSILSPEGKPKYVSPSILKILGYPEEEALEMNLFSLIHPDDNAAVQQVWEKILAHPGIPFYGNICRIRHTDGSWRWIDGTITNMLHDAAIGGIVDNFRDITDTIAADKKLRVSEERYKYLFYNNPLPMWIYDPATLDFLEVNDSAILKYGYTREEFLQLSLLDIRSAEDAAKVVQAVNDRKGKKYYNSGTWQHLTKDKEQLYVEIYSNPVQYEGIDAVLVLANDVTEKNKATLLLFKAYEEKKNILESITDGFLAVDKNWIVTYWNKEAEHMLGMPRENIVGRNIWDVYAVAIPLKFYSECHRAVREHVPVNFEEFFPPLDIWIDASAYPSGDGLSIYFKDITEKKMIQEDIRATNERYEMVAKATNDAIYEWDIVGDVNYWGEGFTTLFGHTIISDEKPVDSWRGNLHPDERDALLQRTARAFADKETSLTRELQFRCADGTYKTVFDKLVIQYDENQQPLKIVGAMQDITERKKNETAIEELNQQLNKRAEELAQSNEELERFAYVASHDLQEPLRMVGSFLQLLQKKYKPQLDETANQYIDFAVDGADRMKRLILDLLEYSRVGTNKELMTNIQMSGIVETILKDFSAKPDGKEIIFRVSLLPEIRGNRMQITQLLQNLVSNAIKYNTSPAPEIEIGYEDWPDHWHFFVKDNGIGIEQKFLEKVFIIFQRLHNKNQFSGTGIGLAICKKIVERHGGSIWIDSVPGQGSTFFFTIKK